MKKFLRKLFFFSLLFLLFGSLSDIFFSYGLRKTSWFQGEFEVWNDIYGGNIRSEIAIYGSSRAFVHFNTKLFEEAGLQAYNLGIDGHNFWLQYLRHKEYFKYNKLPCIILCSVGPYSFSKRKTLYNLQQFLPYMFWNKTYYDFLKYYEGFSLWDYVFPMKRFIVYLSPHHKAGIFYYAFFPPRKGFRYKGFRALKGKWNEDLAKARKEFPSFYVELDASLIDTFRVFLKDLKQKDITPVIIYSPEYIEGQSFIKNRDELIAVFERLSREAGVSFWNYSDSTISKRKEFFINTLHLNSQGADLFTKKVITRLRKEGIIDGKIK